jgi:hypothetical protein
LIACYFLKLLMQHTCNVAGWCPYSWEQVTRCLRVKPIHSTPKRKWLKKDDKIWWQNCAQSIHYK